MQINLTFPSTLDSVPLVRSSVATAVLEAKLTGCQAVVCLLAGELAANAVVHAQSEMDVVVKLQPSRVRVDVIDYGEGMPIYRVPMPMAPTGRGLSLVDTLADRWGVVVEDTWKTVWFEIDRPADADATRGLA